MKEFYNMKSDQEGIGSRQDADDAWNGAAIVIRHKQTKWGLICALVNNSFIAPAAAKSTRDALLWLLYLEEAVKPLQTWSQRILKQFPSKFIEFNQMRNHVWNNLLSILLLYIWCLTHEKT